MFFLTSVRRHLQCLLKTHKDIQVEVNQLSPPLTTVINTARLRSPGDVTDRSVSQLHKGTATLAECKGTSRSQHVISVIFSFFSLEFLQYFLRSGSQPDERGLAHEWGYDREGACDRVAMCQHLLLCRSRVFSTHLKNRPGRGWSSGVTLQELTALSWRSR